MHMQITDGFAQVLAGKIIPNNSGQKDFCTK